MVAHNMVTFSAALLAIAGLASIAVTTMPGAMGSPLRDGIIRTNKETRNWPIKIQALSNKPNRPFTFTRTVTENKREDGLVPDLVKSLGLERLTDPLLTEGGIDRNIHDVFQQQPDDEPQNVQDQSFNQNDVPSEQNNTPSKQNNAPSEQSDNPVDVQSSEPMSNNKDDRPARDLSQEPILLKIKKAKAPTASSKTQTDTQYVYH
ncbi:hypothetical protein BDF19DRAFT_446648, partial [Syncephalis fuscata]